MINKTTISVLCNLHRILVRWPLLETNEMSISLPDLRTYLIKGGMNEGLMSAEGKKIIFHVKVPGFACVWSCSSNITALPLCRS